MDPFGHGAIMDEAPETAGKAGGKAEAGCGLLRIQSKHGCDGSCRREHAARACRMPACAVMRDVAAEPVHPPAADVIAERHGGYEASSIDRAVDKWKSGHRRRENDSAGMVATAGIVQFEGVGCNGVDHRRAARR